MERKLRTCAVCRTSYRYCPKCKEDEKKETWYFTFCSENCKDIYNITSDFEDNRITPNEAKKVLVNLNLSKLDNFGASYTSSINKIMESVVEEENLIVETLQDVEEIEVIDEIKEIEEIEYNIEEEKSIKKPKNKKVRNVEE